MDDYQSAFPGSIETDSLCAHIVSKIKKAKFLVLKPSLKVTPSFSKVLGSLSSFDDESLALALHTADSQFVSSLTLRDFFLLPSFDYSVRVQS